MSDFRSGNAKSPQKGEFDWVWYAQETPPSNPLAKIKWQLVGDMMTVQFPAVSVENSGGASTDMSLTIDPVIIPNSVPASQSGFAWGVGHTDEGDPVKIMIYNDTVDPYLSFALFNANWGATFSLKGCTITYSMNWD